MRQPPSDDVDVVVYALRAVAVVLVILTLIGLIRWIATAAPSVLVIVFNCLCWIDYRGSRLPSRADVEP